MTDSPRDTGDTWLIRLSQSGGIEVALAAGLAVLTAILDLATAQPWQPLVMDLGACVLAAVTPRSPRLAGVALGLLLGTYVLIPPEWATMGEYALLIPILGFGMRGQRAARAAMSVAYFVVLAAISVADAPAGKNPAFGWIAWAVLIGVLRLIGNVFVAATRAHERARQAELVLQRQAVARELHDTVARSLTRVAMAAERARLRGSATDAELDLIAESARHGTQQLRWVMTLLRDSTNLDSLVSTPTPLRVALREGRSELAKHGFHATFSVAAAIDQLDPGYSEALGAVASEAFSNMLKHADPAGPCAIIVDIGEGNAELVFLNRPRQGDRLASETSMGLKNTRDRLEPLGGSIHTESQPAQWLMRATLPLARLAVPPERAA